MRKCLARTGKIIPGGCSMTGLCSVLYVESSQLLLLFIRPVVLFLHIVLVPQTTRCVCAAWKTPSYVIPYHVLTPKSYELLALSIAPFLGGFLIALF